MTVHRFHVPTTANPHHWDWARLTAALQGWARDHAGRHPGGFVVRRPGSVDALDASACQFLPPWTPVTLCGRPAVLGRPGFLPSWVSGYDDSVHALGETT